MRFTTKTEYGIICLIYVARHAEINPVSIKQIVKGEQYSQTFIEKIVQKLRAAHILTSQKGNQGGYALARAASEITLREIIEALEGSTFEVFCEPDVRDAIVCTHFPACDVKGIWEKTKDLLDKYYGSITLEMLASHKIQSADLDKLAQ
ncbi:MAG: Rrf2 family transcriptional regulator [Candidatus Omnitrophota bacterium]|nr:Rrf2 family transcriptional regulator [Candidatus Omnitrophota bacterium]